MAAYYPQQPSKVTSVYNTENSQDIVTLRKKVLLSLCMPYIKTLYITIVHLLVLFSPDSQWCKLMDLAMSYKYANAFAKKKEKIYTNESFD